MAEFARKLEDSIIEKQDKSNDCHRVASFLTAILHLCT